MKLLFIILCIVGGISIYFIFTKPEMSNATKIICKYFEDIRKKQTNKDMEADINIEFNPYIIIEEGILPEVIDYQNNNFQFSGYKINKEAVYSENYIEEDFYDYFNENNFKGNIYRLKNTLLKYGFAYKYEDAYYLYFCLDNQAGRDAKDFDELINEISTDSKLNFYGMELGISTFKKFSYFDKDMVCYGNVNELVNKCIKGKKMKNIGQLIVGRKTITNKTNLKTASILIWGYMEDTKIPFNLHIREDGYLNVYTPGLYIDTCFQMSDEQLEMICQYILQNFDIYVSSETETKP